MISDKHKLFSIKREDMRKIQPYLLEEECMLCIGVKSIEKLGLRYVRLSAIEFLTSERFSVKFLVLIDPPGEVLVCLTLSGITLDEYQSIPNRNLIEEIYTHGSANFQFPISLADALEK